MREYDAKWIILHTWPDLEQMQDGRWIRTFTIRLKEEPILSDTMEELSSMVTEDIVGYMDSEGCVPSLRGDLTILLSPTDPRGITATFITKSDGRVDILLPAAWRMFEDIDRLLGTIDTIEGYARNAYPLWNLQKWNPKNTTDE